MKLFLVLVILVLIPVSFASQGEITIYENGDSFIDLVHNHSFVSDVDLEDGALKGYTEELTSKKGGLWTFNFDEDLNNYDVRLIFPKGASLEEIEVNQNFSISSYKESPVIFVKGDDVLKVKVNYTLSNDEVNRFNGFMILLIFIVIVGLAFGVMYILKKPRKAKLNSDTVDAVKLTLNENQLQLFEVLLTKKNGMNQKELLHITGLPKSSVSRNIELMAQRNVIVKQNAGSTNYLKIHPSMYK